MSIRFYHYLVAVEKLELGKRYTIAKGNYLSLIKRTKKIKIFALNKQGKYFQDLLDDINSVGKIQINIIQDNPDFILFNTSPKEFKPIDWIYNN